MTKHEELSQLMRDLGDTSEPEKRDEALYYQTDLEFVKRHGHAVRYVENQTPEICMAAVRQSGTALQFIKVRTPEICMAAVQADGNALRHVKF